MSYKLLTNLLFEPKGKHDPSLTYTIKDTVMSDDGSKVYFALKDVPAGIPLSDTEYWMLQMDLSSSKNAMDTAAATAKTQTDAVTKSAQDRVDSMVDTAAAAITNLNDYTEQYGLRVRGETNKASGNLIKIYPDAGSLFKPVTTIKVTQEGSGDPYPAGGGKNLLPNNATTKTLNGVTFTVNADRSLTMNGTATSDANFPIFGSGWSDISNKIDLDASETYILSDRTDGAIVYIRDAINDVNIATYSGYNVTFTDVPGITYAYIQVKAGITVNNETIHPMIRLASDPDDSYAPYSNTRPFIGYDKLGLNVTGKNLLPNASAGTKTVNGITLTSNGDGSYNLNGAASSGASIYFALENSVTIPGGAYWHLLNEGITVGAAFTPKFSDGTTGSIAFSIANRVGAIAENLTGKTITEFGVYVQGGTTLDITFKPMLCLSDAPSDFAPYQGKLHTVQIGQTVYGFRYEWLTGKAWIEWAMATLDGTETFHTSNYGAYFYLYVYTAPTSSDGSVINVVSSHFKGVAESDRMGSEPLVYLMSDHNAVEFRNTGFADVTEWKAFLAAQKAAGTPVQVCWKLAQPIEIQLTPTLVMALDSEETNYIYGDGDIEVEYVKPLKVSIAERVDMLLDTFAEPFEQTGNIVTCEPVAGIEFDNVVTVLKPQQEGSGDPYPMGGGKNLFDDTVISQYPGNGTIGSGKITITNLNAYSVVGVDLILSKNTDYYFSFKCSASSGFNVRISYSDDNGTNWTDVNTSSGGRTFNSVDHILYRFTFYSTVERTEPIVFSEIQLELGSVATPYAPYSNIRPFIGYDKLDLNHAGKNLLNLLETNALVQDDITSETMPNSVTFSGAKGTVWAANRYRMYLPDGEYTLSVKMETDKGYKNLSIYISDKLTEGYTYFRMLTDSGSVNFTLDKPSYIEIRPHFTGDVSTQGETWTTRYYDIQIERGTATGFEPYTDTLHTVQIGQTVYGIRYEWLTGKAWIEWTMETLKSADASKWTYVTDYGSVSRFNYNNNNVMPSGDVICNTFPPVSIGTSDVEGIAVHGSQRQIILQIKTDRLASKDVDGLSAWLAGMPIQIVYKLATPIEIQLTPTEIIALSGVNNLYGSGKTTVAGRQSKDVDILRRLTTLETLLTNQTKGE